MQNGNVATIAYTSIGDSSLPKERIEVFSSGKAAVINDFREVELWSGGKCKRISIFLNVFDVHVQNSPISGEITYLKHTPGKFVNAMKTDCATCNENVLIGFLGKFEVVMKRAKILFTNWGTR